MENTQKTPTSSNWTGTQAYVLAVICLVVGVALGYLVRGSASPTAAVPQASAAPSGMGDPSASQAPTPEQMKHMADVQAQPLLDQLKSSPNDPNLLYRVGSVYYDAQQFPEAIRYYEQAAKGNPKGLELRTDLATAYYYAGDADRSLNEFDEVLKIDSKFANALFNQGMIRWQAKMDIKGAVESWKKLIATNPNYENRAQVENLIAKAEQHASMKPGTKTDKSAHIR
ncbi:MAG TPA: tetratricopeptide repeat protein [Terriglobales bacterium]|nr:tetratricopeptide repeat protein [Terriglobales bacterium]